MTDERIVAQPEPGESRPHARPPADALRDLHTEANRYLTRVRERQAAADSYVDRRTYHCLACRDTGFERRLCPEPPNAGWCPICRRQGCHLYDHTWTRPCACRGSNPVFQKQRAAHQPASERGKQAA